VNTSILEQELAPLSAQIEQVRQKREVLEGELHAVEAEIEKFSAQKQRFDALQDVCDALARLGELNADELFWEEIPEAGDAAGHRERLRARITRFEGEVSGILEKQAALRKRLGQCALELDVLDEEVSEAYEREERRREEFVIEREISPVPFRAVVMPWNKEAESERRLRRAVLLALLICFFFGSLIPMINVPIPDRSVDVVEIPERLVKLVKKEPPAPRPKPVPKPEKEKPEKAKEEEPEKPAKEEPKPAEEEPKLARKKPEPVPEQKPPDKPPEQKPPKAAKGGGAAAARKKAERVGVLAFKSAFADLMDETDVAKLGAKARLSKKGAAAGRAVAQRSLVAIQAQGGASGGIGNARVSRNIGNGNVDRLAGAGLGRGGGDGSGEGFARVESSIAGLEESSRPLSGGPAAGRTDEEIQIVFDRYKAALYRIYNRELRKDPTLQGRMLLRITIETSGAVSLCSVESTDLASAELVDKIVARIKRFNFGPKEGVPSMTILYPIDFLPAA